MYIYYANEYKTLRKVFKEIKPQTNLPLLQLHGIGTHAFVQQQRFCEFVDPVKTPLHGKPNVISPSDLQKLAKAPF